MPGGPGVQQPRFYGIIITFLLKIIRLHESTECQLFKLKVISLRFFHVLSSYALRSAAFI
jgi:hypothetical protein